MLRLLLMFLVALSMSGCLGGQSDEAQVEDTLRGYVETINTYELGQLRPFLTDAYYARNGDSMLVALKMAKDLNLKVQWLGVVETRREGAGIIATYRSQSSSAPGTNVVRLERETGKWRIAAKVE